MAPAGAVPSGPPSITLDYGRQSGLTYSLAAQASDSDGDVTRIEMCVEEECTEERFAVSEGADSLVTCLSGDTETLARIYAFPSAGVFEVTVRATGRGCPLVGSPEITTRTFEVEVEALPEPPVREPIPCVDEGPLRTSDRGVDETSVTLGIVTSFLGREAASRGAIYDGVEAARLAINGSGGVCGRQLQLLVVDDGGDNARRQHLLRNMIDADDIFGIVATRMDDVLVDLEDAEVPAIGTPAEVRTEFDNPWAWSISPGNEAFGWIAVEDAYADGARSFALVYDGENAFGLETREAFAAAVASHPDATLVHEDLRYADARGDCLNVFAAQGYTALHLAARAIGLAGVDLTRGGVREVLDTQAFDLALNGGALDFSAPRRQANRWMRAYSIEYKGAFGGLRDVTGWCEDPRG